MRAETLEIFNWHQIKDAVLPYSFDFSAFVDSHSLTFSSATASSSNTSVISIGDESSASNTWLANLTANREGCATITVTATFTGSNVTRKRVFRVNVVDPECEGDYYEDRY